MFVGKHFEHLKKEEECVRSVLSSSSGNALLVS